MTHTPKDNKVFRNVQARSSIINQCITKKSDQSQEFLLSKVKNWLGEKKDSVIFFKLTKALQSFTVGH